MWSICFLIVHGMEPSKAFWARKKERGNLIEWRGLTYLKQKIYSKKAIHSNAFPSRIINVQVLKVRENVMMPSWPNFYPRVQLKTQTSDKRRNLEMNPICICDFSSNGVSPSKVFLQSFQICPATFIASTTSFVECLSRIWKCTEEGGERLRQRGTHSVSHKSNSCSKEQHCPTWRKGKKRRGIIHERGISVELGSHKAWVRKLGRRKRRQRQKRGRESRQRRAPFSAHVNAFTVCPA